MNEPRDLYDEYLWQESLSDLFEIMDRKLLDGSMSFEHAERIIGVMMDASTRNAEQRALIEAAKES